MILFFDTETTGLPKNWKAPVTDLDNWPRLVQLAYLVYDFDGNLIHSCNEIVKPDGFTIPLDASNVHGITTEIANQRGSKIEEVLELFSIHLKRAKVIVAHNMAYDEKIIGSEMIRLGMENTVDSKEKICTMESTVDLCKIDGPYGYKWPKLEELHRFLFNHYFEGAHDALADIQATAKCFWELKKRGIIKLFRINWSPSTKKRIEELAKQINAENISEFNVPFLSLDNNGAKIWRFFNTKNEIIHGEKTTKYDELDFTKLEDRLRDPYIWDPDYCNYTMNLQEYTTNDWKCWSLDRELNLIYKNKIVLYNYEIEEFTLNISGYSGFGSYTIYNSKEEDISKLIALCQLGDEDGRPEAPFYQTIFYFNNKGIFFYENNYMKFQARKDVPFLKINKDGNSEWQLYRYDKAVFFGEIFENHYKIENEIKSRINLQSTYFWSTDYSPSYTGHLIELDEWKGWSTNEEGDLFFNKEYKLNLFDLNLNFRYVDGGPILRFLDSENNISKLIAYCQDGDQYGVYDWYETQFYLNDSGRIYLENNYTPPKEFDIFDAWEAIAEYEAEKNFHDDDFGMIP
jgi:DNA polymerase III epsilon subunit-like protein